MESPRVGILNGFFWGFVAYCALDAMSLFGVTPAWHDDPLYEALWAAEKELEGGNDRTSVASSLERAIRTDSSRHLVSVARGIIEALEETHLRELALPGDQDHIRLYPEEYLMESRVSSSLLEGLLRNRNQWDRILKKYPDDPVSIILRQGRPAIERLIPRIDDPSVARTSKDYRINYSLPEFLRVRDLAVFLIEGLSGCRFRLNGNQGERVQELKRRIRVWWHDSGRHSFGAGVRSQIERLDTAERPLSEVQILGMVEMAAELLVSKDETDAAYGLAKLKRWVTVDRSMKAARALARLGNHWPLDHLLQGVRQSELDPSKVLHPSEIHFLMEYGSRLEWEMLHALALREIEFFGQVPKLRDGPNPAGVIQVILSGRSDLPLWVVPCLALALDQTKRFDGNRFLAAQATSMLQHYTRLEFGHVEEDSTEEQLQAVGQAKRWWEETGQKLYSFEAIDAVWAAMTFEIGDEPVGRGRFVGVQKVPSGRYSFEWKLRSNGTGVSREPLKEEDYQVTRFVVEVEGNRVSCVASSDARCVGARGQLTSEGRGRFGFRLELDGFEDLSHQWIAAIDSGFFVNDADGQSYVMRMKDE